MSVMNATGLRSRRLVLAWAVIGTLMGGTLALCVFDASVAAQNRPAGAPAPLNLNTASVDQLRSGLRITETDARRIVGGRPYRSAEELVRKQVISKAAYEKIRKRIFIGS